MYFGGNGRRYPAKKIQECGHFISGGEYEIMGAVFFMGPTPLLVVFAGTVCFWVKILS